MPRTLPALALAALLAAAPALAGDEANPEITDPSGDAGPAAAWGDLVAGWFNDTATDISVTLVMAQLPASSPGYSWFVVADIGAATYGWGAFDNGGGNIQYFHGTWDRNTGPTDFQTGTGEFATGSPGRIMSNLPKAYAGNATWGSVVSGVQVSTGQVNFPLTLVPVPVPVPGSVFYVQMDDAQGSDYTLAFGAPAEPIAPGPGGPNGTAPNGTSPNGTASQEPPRPAPGPEAALLAAGVVAVAVAARRRP